MTVEIRKFLHNQKDAPLEAMLRTTLVDVTIVFYSGL